MVQNCLPADVRKTLDEALFKVVQDPAFAEVAKRLDVKPNPVHSGELMDLSLVTMDSYKTIMEALGFTKK